MQPPSFFSRIARFARRSSTPHPPIPLTRKEFYDLAAYCREKALELARHDQSRVSLPHCYEFNAWLPRIQAYDRLARPLRGLQPARPVARWQVMTLAIVIGFILMMALPSRFGMDRSLSTALLSGYGFSLIILYFVPERLYGTTVELLEAKMLRIVEALEQVLLQDEMGFTEAAFHRVKENLDVARRELRQQIDLAHR